MTERIQKLLATAGIASRRAIEDWIAEGRITVNGRPAEIGQKVNHDDNVRVDGRLVALARKAAPVRVILFRKKTGELVTRDDPDGRRTVFRKLPELQTGRWIAVGRLDINTSGLLLMTTDGELARRLTHPSFEVTRTYAVRVLGEMTDEIRKRLLKGVELEDGPAKCESLKSADPPDAEDAEGAANRWYEITMREGRNRIVRRLFEAVDMQVSRLIRIAYGPVQLGRGIKAGSYREATPDEMQALLHAVKLDEAGSTATGDAPARHYPTRAPRRDDEDAQQVDRRKPHAEKRGRAASPKGRSTDRKSSDVRAAKGRPPAAPKPFARDERREDTPTDRRKPDAGKRSRTGSPEGRPSDRKPSDARATKGRPPAAAKPFAREERGEKKRPGGTSDAKRGEGKPSFRPASGAKKPSSGRPAYPSSGKHSVRRGGPKKAK